MSNNYQIAQSAPLQIGQIVIEKKGQIEDVDHAVRSLWASWDEEQEPTEKALKVRQGIATNNWA